MSQERVAASMTVRGMETANRRSDSAREEMKMLRAVLSSGRHTAASITARLPGTAEYYLVLLNFGNVLLFPGVFFENV